METLQSDVINSTLLAQLAANKQYDRQNNVDQWYGYYKTVLEQVGWTVQNFEWVTTFSLLSSLRLMHLRA